ncbi:MAG: cytochrome c biogenesis protein CcsA [Phycisphaeraceae bacterium]
MPHDLATGIPLIFATLASLAAAVLVARHLRDGKPDARPILPQAALLGGVTLACLGLLIYRVAAVHQAWVPVQAHVDGLLLIALLLAPSILYIQTRPRLFGLSLFALPLLALILAWGVCAALWTYRAFDMDSFAPAWKLFHLAVTYVGLLGCGLGAAGGAMYLFVQGRLKAKAGLGQVNPMASLETLETLILRAATLGFVLLTLSLVSGFIMVTQATEATSIGAAWWASLKVWLAASAWAVYAVLINVRTFTSFRGRRAAWLAIAGLVLVLATYGAVEAIDRNQPDDPATPPQAEVND